GLIRAGLEQVVVIDGSDRLGRSLVLRARLRSTSVWPPLHEARGNPNGRQHAKTPDALTYDSRDKADRCAHGDSLASPPRAPAQEGKDTARFTRSRRRLREG